MGLEIARFLLENKEEILKEIDITSFDERKDWFTEFPYEWEKAREMYILQEVVYYLVDLGYNYRILRSVITPELLERIGFYE